MKAAPASSDAQAILERSRKDPTWFHREILGFEPWAKQIEITEAVRDHQRVSVRSCHGIGKSAIAARISLSFLFSHPGSIVLTTAPTDRQVRGILWKEIGIAYERSRVPLGGRCLTQELKLDRDWFAWGFTAPDYDDTRFQGFHAEHLLVVVDEACGISPQIHEGIEGVLSNDNARLLQIGNPTDPDTEFGRSFQDPNTAKIGVSAYESPNFTAFGITEDDVARGSWEAKIDEDLPAPWLVTPAWVADKYRKWGPESPLYIARVKGQFPQSSDDALIPYSWIEAAQARTLEPVGPGVLGVDVARYGPDKTVLIHTRGPVARTLGRHSKQDTMTTSGQVVRALGESGASAANVDVVGIGAGVVDRLLELGRPVHGVNVGESATDGEQFANWRAELYWGLRERFEAGDIDLDPQDEELASQLASIRFKVDSRGRVAIESKDDMKKRGVPSPDDADALALAYARPRITEVLSMELSL